jgi:hypothetical protein
MTSIVGGSASNRHLTAIAVTSYGNCGNPNRMAREQLEVHEQTQLLNSFLV